MGHNQSPRPDALAVRGLVRTFGAGENAAHALRGIDLRVATGGFTAVMGPSGSGKSTLLNCVAGLESVDSGTIAIEGQDITGWSQTRRAKFRRTRVGLVFQDFQLIPYLTVEQNIGLPTRLAGRRPDRDRVHAILAAVGLDERAKRLPSELSGGQQQRVAIARALLNRPALLLADEPTGALDSGTARGVLRLLRAAVDRSGHTVIMVTHDPSAASYADHVLFLLDGSVAAQMPEPTVDAVSKQVARLEESVGDRVAP